nr:thioredoxin fold domain-containing protein [uncultured Carboxylicivirga sp.]
MKKSTIALVVLMLLVGILIIASFYMKKEVDDQLVSLSKMPDFKITMSGNMIYTKDSLWQDYNNLFVFYKPGCDHCDYLMNDIKKHPDYFLRTMVFFLTTNKFDVNQDNSEVNIFTGLVSDYLFNKVFYVKGTPKLLLYNSDKQLVYVNTGEVNTETILSHIIEANESTPN